MEKEKTEKKKGITLKLSSGNVLALKMAMEATEKLYADVFYGYLDIIGEKTVRMETTRMVTLKTLINHGFGSTPLYLQCIMFRMDSESNYWMPSEVRVYESELDMKRGNSGKIFLYRRYKRRNDGFFCRRVNSFIDAEGKLKGEV